MFITRFLVKLNLILLAMVYCSVLSAQTQYLLFDNAWIREMPPGTPTLAAYMTITNPGENTIRITALSSNVSKSTELHEVSMKNDLMKMRRIPELVIAPGQSIELKQGVMHLMLTGVEKTLKDGDEVVIEFGLQDLPPAEIVVSVKKVL